MVRLGSKASQIRLEPIQPPPRIDPPRPSRKSGPSRLAVSLIEPIKLDVVPSGRVMIPALPCRNGALSRETTPDLQIVCGQNFMQSPPARSFQQRINSIALFMPTFHLCLFAGSFTEFGRSQVTWIQVRIADNPHPINAADLFVNQIKNGGAEVSGNPVIDFRALKSVL